MQRRHTLLADEALVGGNCSIVHVAIEIGGSFPRLLIGIAHDHIKADAIFGFAFVMSSTRLHGLDLVPDLLRRLAPGKVGIDMFCRDIERLVGRATDLTGRFGMAKLPVDEVMFD